MPRDRTCERCGRKYEARQVNQRWCPACRSAAVRERESVRQRARRWELSHNCPSCGKIRHYYAGARLCAQCRGLQVRKGAMRSCYWCGTPLYQSPWLLGRKRVWCKGCLGTVSAYAAEVGLSRQRVAQLVSREFRRLREARPDVTRAEALARVREARRLETGHPPTAGPAQEPS
jgi:hypothetical protein